MEERERERKEREKREKEKYEKLAKLAKLDQLEKKKESGRTAAALSVLLPFQRFRKSPPLRLIFVYNLEIIFTPPGQEIFILCCFYPYIHIEL